MRAGTLSCLEDTIRHGPPGGRAYAHSGVSYRHSGLHTGRRSAAGRSRARRFPRPRATPLSPRQVEIFAAIPRGFRRARSQGAWLAHVKAHQDYAALRSDRQRNWREIIGVLARYADWTARTTRPTWALIARQAGVSRATVARCIAWLVARGLLGVVESGTTPLFRTGVLYGPDPGAENRAAEYVLTVRAPMPRPRRARTGDHGEGREETETPSWTRQGPRSTPSRTRTADTLPSLPWQITLRPTTRTDRLRAAEELRHRSPLLAELSPGHLRHLLSPYWLTAGWTPADCLHCLDHRPDGRLQPYSDRVRHVPSWIRHRLRAWHAADGTPLQAPSQLRAEHRRRVRAEQDARRRERDRAAAMVADYTRRASDARRQLAAVSANAARVIRRADLFLAAAASARRRVPDAAPAAAHVAPVAPARGARDWAAVARALLPERDPSVRESIIVAALSAGSHDG